MRRIQAISLLGLFAALLAVPAGADAQIRTGGKTQLGVSGFGGVGERNFGSVTFSITQYVSDSFEIGADTNFTFTERAGGTQLNGFFFGRIRYNFVGQSMTVPYLSAGGGTNLASGGGASSFDFVVFDAGIGLKHFLNERVSFNAEASGRAHANGDFEIQEQVYLQAGLSMYLGG